MINYRYVVQDHLGAGGDGEVIRVEDSLLGRSCAMKVLRPTTPGTVNEESLWLEFSRLSMLKHDHLIQVFEFGKVVSTDIRQLLGRPFYTMEYLAGKNSLDYLSSLPAGTHRLAVLETMFIQILTVLDYIHQEGILHFDIKPQNIIVCDHGDGIHVTLTDFGFSAMLVESINVPIRGTFEYLAPEIIQGKSADQRMDLYSLGVSFYHLLSSQCPFQARTSVEVVKNILSIDLPCIELAGGERSILPGIIQKLCRRNPDERFASARDVLMEFSASKYEDSLKKGLYLQHQASFVGRKEEMTIIERSLRGLDTKPQLNAALVVGAEGIGKTEFLIKARSLASMLGILVVELSGNESMRSRADLANAFRQINLTLKTIGVEPREVPSCVEGCCWNEEEMRLGAVAVAEHLIQESHHIPFLVIVDDVDKLNFFTTEALRAMIGSSTRGNTFILASISNDNLIENPFDRDAVVTLLLNELTTAELSLFFERSLSKAFVDAGFVERFHALYGGAPAVAREAAQSIANAFPLRVLHDPAGLLEASEDLTEFLALKFEEYFGRRYLTLRKEKQLLLQIISCFDHPPLVDLVKLVTPFQRTRLEHFLLSLEYEGYLHTSEFNGRYTFRHLSLKKLVYESIENRGELHGFLAQQLERMQSTLEEQDVSEMALQFMRASENEKASKYYELAAGNALHGKLHEVASQHLKNAVQLNSSEGEDFWRLQVMLGDTLFKNGEDRESISVFTLLLQHLPDDDQRRQSVYTMLGKAHARLGETALAQRYAEDALAVASDSRDRFEIQQEIISIHISEGNYDRAIALGAVQERFAVDQPDKQLLALVETDQGIARFFKGEFQEALHSFHAALKLYMHHGNHLKTIDALNNIGNVLSAMRDYRGALEKWRQALQMSTDRGTEYQRGQILNNIGIAYYHLREYAESQTHYQQSKDIFNQLNSHSGIAYALTNLGEVSHAQGSYEVAIGYWREALDIYRLMQDSCGMAQTLLQSAQMHLTLGSEEVALQMIDEVSRLIGQHKLTTLDAFYHYLRGQLFLLRHDYPSALSELEHAEQGFRQNGAFTGGSESEQEKECETILRTVEVKIRCREYSTALTLLSELACRAAVKQSPILEAELCYYFGVLARACPGMLDENPLMYFRRGLSIVEAEYVTEISWKLSYSLGCEYARRGNKEKAREHLVNAKVVMEFFLSKFTLAHLRQGYLGREDRATILHDLSLFE